MHGNLGECTLLTGFTYFFDLKELVLSSSCSAITALDFAMDSFTKGAMSFLHNFHL